MGLLNKFGCLSIKLYFIICSIMAEIAYTTHHIIPHIISCMRERYMLGNYTSYEEGLFITNEVVFYTFPVILTIGLVFSVINSIITARMATDSHECYLTAFNVASTILLICCCVLHLPNYIKQDYSAYRRLLPYLPAVEAWCWQSCSWLLITVTIERAAHSLCGKWHSSFGRVHGVLVSVLIVIICFVSTLPMYWEYDLDTVAYQDCGRIELAPRVGVLEYQGGPYIMEYQWFHWYQVIVGIGLPYLILPMLLPALVCIPMHIYTSSPRHMGTKVKYSIGSSMKERLRQERSFNRLICLMVVLYLIMSGPRNVLNLVRNPPIGMEITSDGLLLLTLMVAFDVIFYSFFTLLFFFYLTFGNKFRTALYQLCCCRKHQVIDYYN